MYVFYMQGTLKCRKNNKTDGLDIRRYKYRQTYNTKYLILQQVQA